MAKWKFLTLMLVVACVADRAGSADGLKQGMELYVHSPSTIYGSASVTSVSEHSAMAVMEMEADDTVPATGGELSTKL